MEKTNSYLIKPINKWNLYEWKDFHTELKKHIKGESSYIRNKYGGYLSFYWNEKSSKIKGKEFEYFLELIEDKLFFKIITNDHCQRKKIRDFYRDLLSKKANELNIKISLFDRLGKVCIIATLNSEYLITNKSKIINIQKTCYNLKSITKLMDEVEKEINNLYQIQN